VGKRFRPILKVTLNNIGGREAMQKGYCERRFRWG